jgi:hypothetical protein
MLPLYGRRYTMFILLFWSECNAVSRRMQFLPSSQGPLLGEVGLQSLLERRMEHSVIFLFKLFRGLQDCTPVLERISLRVSRTGSRVRSVFYIGQYHTDLGSGHLLLNVTRIWAQVTCYSNVA